MSIGRRREADESMMRGCRKAIETESEMNESGLFIENESLFDTLRSEQCLITGFKQIKKNNGKSGIGGVFLSISWVYFNCKQGRNVLESLRDALHGQAFHRASA